MKLLERGLFLFIILVLVLTSGSTYVGLNQAANSQKKKDEQKMTVALVNEDLGKNFNGKHYEFGDQFIRGIEKDDEHNWYVVTRGMAEQGVKRNTYNMMIVIPEDFSSKALSMNEKNPEKPLIHYRVNASSNSNMKAMAEQTASTILGDFNRRIIDVFFASVLKNLQNAQGNVAEVVNKEQTYTSVYNESVHAPISGYTNQLGSVENSTKSTKDSFKAFQKMLGQKNGDVGTFKQAEQLLKGTDSKAESPLATYVKNLSELYSQDYDKSVKDLSENSKVLAKFIDEKENPSDSSLQTITTKLQATLKVMKDSVGNYSKSIDSKHEYFSDKLKPLIEKALIDDPDQAIPLYNLLKDTDKRLQGDINSIIEKLPPLTEQELAYLKGKTALTTIRNVQIVSSKYKEEFLEGKSELSQVNDNPELQETSVNDSVEIPDSGGEKQSFSLNVPEDYSVKQVLLALPGESEHDYSSEYQENGRIELPKSQSGSFAVKLVLKTKNDDVVPAFRPIRWGWKLNQESREGNGSQGVKAQKTKKAPTTAQKKSENEEQSSKKENEKEKENKKEKEVVKVPEKQESVTITKNSIAHKLTSYPGTSSVEDQVDHLLNTISIYEDLATRYQTYFGFNLQDAGLEERLNNSTLKTEAGKETSLYNDFQNKNVAKGLSDYVISQLKQPLIDEQATYKSKVDQFGITVNGAWENADDTAKEIETISGEAGKLNTSIITTTKQLTDLKTKMEAIKTSGAKLVTDQGTASVNAASVFGKLLAQSQLLETQTKSNASAADSVYSSFDSIHEQAAAIKNSGKDLVAHSNDLSKKLENKLSDDKNFAKNFADVMSNSKVGNRPNEQLLNFLSEPVDAKNKGIVTQGNIFTPYFVVFIGFIITLFTAYVLANYERRRAQDDDFEREFSLFRQNIPMTVFILIVGVIEGIVTGLLAAYFLHIKQGDLLLWMILVILMMTTLVTFATYMMRQLKMVGMFVLLAILTLYLFFTNALGLHFDQASVMGTLRTISPLQYIEKLIGNFIDGPIVSKKLLLGLVIALLLSILGNTLTLHKKVKDGEEADEEAV
ncbi:hypothetical protein A374_18816 [Fictibacillus macauensis ZFHKF-1]|uniref:Type VII secretion system accessory factor EsaA n=1 Tax=Fictibacillus macauensis ZFHKF-1 TaxID=1196324 RepID=I8IWA4_9BACL|nr:type VII secretion protein EsaA [Fictibacillus macauensis]EIT83771.1 hypothetical protein A374_18816 [Fictibacillus macauensis ZFHKF-1]